LDEAVVMTGRDGKVEAIATDAYGAAPDEQGLAVRLRRFWRILQYKEVLLEHPRSSRVAVGDSKETTKQESFR